MLFILLSSLMILPETNCSDVEVDSILEEVAPSFERDAVRSDRVRLSSLVRKIVSPRLSYVVAKVQAEPFIGEINETAVWVVLRNFDEEYFLPSQEDSERLPEEIQKLLETLDPSQLKSKSVDPFIRALYTKSDWGRAPASEPSSYKRLRESSAMKVSELKLNHHSNSSSIDRPTLDPEGVRRFGKSSLRRFRGVWIAEVFGDRNQMAYQQGVLMQDLAVESALLHYGTLIDQSIDQSPLIRRFPFLSGLVKAFVRWGNFSSLKAHLPPGDLEVIKEFSRGARVSSTVVERSVLLPDVAQYLMARSFAGLGKMMGAFGNLPSLGCSTVARMNPNGEIGQILARNLDYEGGGLYDAQAMVLYARATKPDLSFISFTTLGNPLGVVTAHNEAGLSIFLHQLMVDRVSKVGRPILSVLDEVIRRARSLDEAVAILRRNRHASTWRVILSSKSENRSLSVELSAKNIDILDLNSNTAVLTNTPVASMQLDEFASGFNYWADSRLREETLIHRGQSSDEIDLQQVIDWIASDEIFNSTEGRLDRRFGGGTVGRRNNVQSVILLPDQKRAYLAVPSIPFARPLDGHYIPLPMEFGTESVEASLSHFDSSFQKSNPLSLNQVKAQAFYRRAIPAMTKEGRFKSGAYYLEEAHRLDPYDYVYPLMAGVAYFLVAWQSRDEAEKASSLVRAEDSLRMAQGLQPSSYHLSLIYLLRSRLLFIAGRDQEARVLLQNVGRGFSKPLTEAAESAERNGYSLSNARSLTPDLGNIDITRF